VLGGDQSQAIGSISGMKDFMPEAKLIWIDAQLDAKSPETTRDANGIPLSILSGKVPGFKNWDCVDIKRDLCYFGIRKWQEEEARYISENNVLVFEPSECNTRNIRGIKSHVNKYFSQYGEHSLKSKYWISFDADSIDSSLFKSNTEIMPEVSGLSLDFIFKLFEVYTPHSIGMDFSEINFS
jgi:arginase family enzyme